MGSARIGARAHMTSQLALRFTAAERVKELLSFSDGLLSLEGAGLMAFDKNLRCIYWSAVMEELSGISAADALGGEAQGASHFVDQIAGAGHLRKAIAGHQAIVRGVRYFRPDSARQETFFDAHYSPLAHGSNEIVGTVAVLHDVTAQKLAEHHLRETESRFRHMADAAPVLLWMAGPDSLCTFFNQTWLDFTGRTLAQEWGVGWAEGIYFEDFQRCMDTYIAAFSARSVFEIEYRLRRRDGAFRWILDRGIPRYLLDGTFAGYIGSCIDITEKRQIEAELRKAVRDRDDFLSIASHELRTPLTTLQLEVENLQRNLPKWTQGGTPNGRISRGVEATAAQATRLIRLVEELLDMSRLAAGQLRLQPKDVDLGELVKEAVLRFKAALEMAGSSVELCVAERAVGSWDRLRLEQVANNLLSNAVKYGAGKPIAIEVARDGDHAVLIIRDLGIGIAKEDHVRIFRRFERAVSAANYGGFGLGLWITQEIARAHGGTIAVESTLEAGATFTVRLPLDPSSI
jgi:PAS domain S-box-containing protein